MKLIKVTAAMVDRWDPATPASKCPVCTRRVRVGQWVLQHRLRPATYVDPTLNIHGSCALQLVENCPEDDVEPASAPAALAALRRQSRRDGAARRAAEATAAA